MKVGTFARSVTVFAIGFLLLDAVLFMLAGRYVWGTVCAIAAGLVFFAWRRYRRVMAELADARREMKREAESIRDLLHTHFRN